MRELVHEPMNTRSSAICSIGVPGSQVHVGERALGRLAVGGAVELLGRGHALGDGAHHAGVRAPGDLRGDRGGVDDDLGVELGALVGAQLAPARDRLVELLALRRARALAVGEPGEGGLVGRDHAGAPAALDRHVADGHAPLHRERLDRRAGVLDDVAGHAADAELAERAEDQVLGGDAEAELALVEDAHRARLVLDHALGGQSTCSTSLVPMPKASAPKAPWVEVCESPQTIVMPGWVTPSSGPITCTMPWRSEPSE